MANNSDRKAIYFSVEGHHPPHDTHVWWVDTTDTYKPILKTFLNGAWTPILGAGGSPAPTPTPSPSGDTTTVVAPELKFKFDKNYREDILYYPTEDQPEHIHYATDRIVIWDRNKCLKPDDYIVLYHWDKRKRHKSVMYNRLSDPEHIYSRVNLITPVKWKDLTKVNHADDTRRYLPYTVKDILFHLLRINSDSELYEFYQAIAEARIQGDVHYKDKVYFRNRNTYYQHKIWLGVADEAAFTQKDDWAHRNISIHAITEPIRLDLRCRCEQFNNSGDILPCFRGSIWRASNNWHGRLDAVDIHNSNETPEENEELTET